MAGGTVLYQVIKNKFPKNILRLNKNFFLPLADAMRGEIFCLRILFPEGKSLPSPEAESSFFYNCKIFLGTCFSEPHDKISFHISSNLKRYILTR